VKWGNEWLERGLAGDRLERLNHLSELALKRNQTLAQMALAWTLRMPEVTSALIGASSLAQIRENVAALDNLSFTDEELAEIDRLAPRGE
jgi:L-glyceraldehyde 3-phosphate reductase